MIYIGAREYKYGRMKMSHMISDKDISELHWVALVIGVKKKYFQDKPGKPHYDVCKKMKKLAIDLEAKEVSEKEIIQILKAKYNEKDTCVNSPTAHVVKCDNRM